MEASDLLLLSLCLGTIPFVWLALLGWDSSLFIGGHDGLYQTLPFLNVLTQAGGSWTHLTYRLSLEGGIKVHAVSGTLPFFEWMAWLGLSPVSIFNLFIFFVQVFYAFLGTRAAYDLARLLADREIPRRLPVTLGLILLCAFSPVMATQLSYAAGIAILGTLVFVVILSLSLAVWNQSMTVTLLGIAALTLMHAFTTHGQQLVLYAVVFGAPIYLPILLPLWRKRREPGVVRGSLALALVFVGAFLISLPKFAAMVRHVLSTDSSRQLGGGESVIYSYITATVKDWIASVPWGKDLFHTANSEFAFHEVNYGFGPPLLLLAFFPWKKAKWLGAGLLASFTVAILFSLNVPGVATVLQTLIPGLGSFRVPERAILPFVMGLPIVAGAVLLQDRQASGNWPTQAKASAFGAGFGALALAVGGWWREALEWALTLGLPRLRRPEIAGILLLALGLGSIAAFQERLLPFHNANRVLENPAQIGSQVKVAAPDLNSELDRVSLDFEITHYGANTEFVAGLSSINGYFFPVRRFRSLVAAVLGQADDPLRCVFRFRKGGPGASVLDPLYNVKYEVAYNGHQVGLRSTGPTAGPAWFSQGFRTSESIATLARELQAQGANLVSTINASTWVVGNDPWIIAQGLTPMLTRAVSPDCARSQVIKATTPGTPDASVKILVRNELADCPLTVAMNFAEELRATAMVGSRAMPISVFPAFGALTGLIVPQGASEITIEAVPFRSVWLDFAWGVGIMLLGLAALAIRKPGFPPAPRKAQSEKGSRKRPIPDRG